MADEKEVKTKDGSLLFIKERDGMTLSGIKWHATLITVPTEVEGLPVRAVAKKAFLGNKDLTEVILPDSLDEIGDWAFAHCGSLKKITLPGRKISIGRGIFKDCKMLEQVRTGRREDIAWLLAATPILLDAEYLFVPEDAGSEEWLEKWDNRMKTLLFQEDEAGFTRLVLCGEEDLLASLPEYVAERRDLTVRTSLFCWNTCVGTQKAVNRKRRGKWCFGSTETNVTFTVCLRRTVV